LFGAAGLSATDLVETGCELRSGTTEVFFRAALFFVSDLRGLCRLPLSALMVLNPESAWSFNNPFARCPSLPNSLTGEASKTLKSKSDVSRDESDSASLGAS
jgi:hypothetical protein